MPHSAGFTRYTGPAIFRREIRMSEKTFARAVAIAALAASTLVASGQNAPATLTIHPDQPVAAVSPTLYGLMTEEINYSYDGGLYAEMVRNRTFRGDWSGILYWYLVEDGNARAKMAVDESTGPSTALPKSLKIEIEQADAQNQAGVLNVGWWGMALHAQHGVQRLLLRQGRFREPRTDHRKPRQRQHRQSRCHRNRERHRH